MPTRDLITGKLRYLKSDAYQIDRTIKLLEAIYEHDPLCCQDAQTASNALSHVLEHVTGKSAKPEKKQ